MVPRLDALVVYPSTPYLNIQTFVHQGQIGRCKTQTETLQESKRNLREVKVQN